MKKITCWEELVGLESENYYLVIDLDMRNGWIKPKEHYKDVDSVGYYLTTHTFYHPENIHISLMLQKCGFNVELISDGKDY